MVYAGTASNCLAPALRLAWLVLPVRLVDDIVPPRNSPTAPPGRLDQLALAELIISGAYDRQVRRARLIYRRRRDRLVAALRRAAPAAQVSGISAGHHLLLELPAGLSEDEVIARAARHDLALAALHSYTDELHTRPPALVIGYGRPPEHAFTAALARLTAVLGADQVVPATRPRRIAAGQRPDLR